MIYKTNLENIVRVVFRLSVPLIAYSLIATSIVIAR